MTMVNFRDPFFYRTFLFLVLAELLSIFGYLLPPYTTVAFFLIVFLVVALTLWKREYGCYIILTELFVGGKGFLFFWTVGGTMISLRIALWLVVMSVWGARFLTQKEERHFWKNVLQHSIMMRFALVFFIVITLATLHGFFHNAATNVFFDMNAWLFFLLLFPFFSALRRSEQYEHIFQMLFAAVAWTSFQALAILFVYAHDPLGGVFLPLYGWVRMTGVGEITALTPTFARIFFQSQIYTLVAFFILLISSKEKTKILRTAHYTLLILFFTSLLLSFSRSFWLAGIVTLFVTFVLGFEWKKIGVVLAIGIASFVLIFSVINFPYPRALGGSFASLLEDRATQTQEAGLSSRWSLLPPLLATIRQHWFWGAGFGATVTYKSSDPRIVESSARGNNFYTTYAFEWGYLDLFLKFGFIGFCVYLALLWMIAKRLYYQFLPPEAGPRKMRWQFPNAGLFLGFIALLITNIFSPYLNHPLGIGILFLCFIFPFTLASDDKAEM